MTSTATTLERGTLSLTGADTQVPLIDGTTITYANLDSAASAPALESVTERVNQVLPLYASVHRGAGYLSQVCTALYESARQTIGRFVGARATDVTIITRNSTDSLNLLAGCVKVHAASGERSVLVLELEHHANLLPWKHSGLQVTVLEIAPTAAATTQRVLDQLKTGHYSLLALTGASNVTGEALDIQPIITAAHAAGTRVVVDGAQLVPHRGFSLTESGADYVVFSGHKTYAPFGAGALVGKRDWLDEGTPYLAGGGAVRQVTISDVTWAAAPARHEAGSPNVIGAVALAAACDALAALPEGALQAHEAQLRERLVEGLSQIPGVEILKIWPDAAPPVAVVSFTVADSDPGLVAAYLAAEHGIGVRDGRFCAHPLLQRLHKSEGALRASLSVGSTSADVERLISAVSQYVQDGPSVEYVVQDGCWVVANDPRPLPDIPGLAELAGTAAAGLLAQAQVCGTFEI